MAKDQPCPRETAGGMLRGARRIGGFVGLNPRQANAALAAGLLFGAFKLNGIWHALPEMLLEGLRRRAEEEAALHASISERPGIRQNGGRRGRPRKSAADVTAGAP